jgi:predicted nucleic acid-binding protein
MIDTSAWVDYLRGDPTAAARRVRELVSTQPAELAICEPIAMELLAGAGDETMLARLDRLTSGLPTLRMAPDLDFRAAAALYRQARAHGETIRSLVDCLIAAVALRHGIRVVHKDRDLEVLGRTSGLDQESCR